MATVGIGFERHRASRVKGPRLSDPEPLVPPIAGSLQQGRVAWQVTSGYTKRARAETAMSRFKRVIGDGLRSHTDDRRATEVEVAVHVLNRMLDLGRPNSVRIA